MSHKLQKSQRSWDKIVRIPKIHDFRVKKACLCGNKLKLNKVKWCSSKCQRKYNE